MKSGDKFYELLKSAAQRSEEFNDAAAAYVLLKKADFEDEHGTGGPPLSDREFNKLTETKKKPKEKVAALPSATQLRFAEEQMRRAAKVLKHAKDKPGKHFLASVGAGSVAGAAPGAFLGAVGSRKKGVKGRAKGALKGALVVGAAGGAIGGMHGLGRIGSQAAIARQMDVFKKVHGPGGVMDKAHGVNDLARAFAKGKVTRDLATKKYPSAGVMPSIVKKTMDKNAVASTPPPISITEIKERAAEKYPQQEVPSLAEEAGGIWSTIRKKYRDYKKSRLEFEGVTKPVPVLKEASIQSALKQVIPKRLTDPGALTLAGSGAALLGLSTYLSSKPRESLGGKSKAEMGLEGDVRANKARGGSDYPSGIGAHMTEFKHGLSTEMRKHPGAAAATGAAVGGGLGMSLARILGALKR